MDFSEILNTFEDRTKVDILFPTKTKLSCAICKIAQSTKKHTAIIAKWLLAAAAKKLVFYLYLQPIRRKLIFFLVFEPVLS